ncbi:MAG: AAA family ATPase [Candidatus Gastranaerophilales bacterium]|nr:AAA family ATPase [Candidatus Gastranaerophilales bacterium]
MLQEATKLLNSAFHNSFIKRLSLYLHDCVREEVKSSTFRNLKQDKDNKWIFLREEHLADSKSKSKLPMTERLFTDFGEPVLFDGSNSNITELMIQSENGQKDKYLIYGYLFLAGKNSKSRKYNEFLTPLLYMPCRLERDGLYIKCTLQDEVLSVNTGALTALMAKSDDEEETEQMLEGILDVVPPLPLTEEGIQIFVTTLKSLIPDIDIKLKHEVDVYDDSQGIENGEKSPDDEDSDKNKIKSKIEKVAITNQSALILTKRPDVTAGVLHELTKISEMPSGVFRETVLNLINEEYLAGKGKMDIKMPNQEISSFFPVTPLPLSDSQEDVIKNLENNSLIAVSGPPGTGKSQTIVNLVSHLVANGQTVLVASRMDKATDVIADRLNELGAPYLALRAGRLNYQRDLSAKLQNLISNKIDLDSGFEDAMLVTVDDMKLLHAKINDRKKRCDEIIALEEKWHEVISEKNKKQEEKAVFIRKKLNIQEVNDLKKIVDDIEKDLEKQGFFSKFNLKTNCFKLRKLLKLVDFEPDWENLTQIRKELAICELTAKAAKIEADIFKLGNITELTDEIHDLQSKQKSLAINILRNVRREALKGLLRDSMKRKRLFVHTKALVERKKNLQNRLLEEEDFRPLLEAFPCQCVTTYAVSGSLPMKPGLFDVAIIDEASQCDIASCIPILFRAKKAVIVGDDKQLPHLSFLENAKEQSFLSQYDIPDKYRLMWRFRTNSMFDLAGYYCMTPVLLDEHFRSLPPIIEFSNKEFYGGGLRIMKRNDDSTRVLELCRVPLGKVDGDATRNIPEIEAVIEKLHEIIIADEAEAQKDKHHKFVSVGIISPFRSQVEAIKKSLMKSFSDATLQRHQVDVGTAHTFQGDERDIIIMSWAIADNSFAQSLAFLQKPNLFNVAVTRARKKCISFLSKDPDSFQPGLMRNYIEHIRTYEAQRNLVETNGYISTFNNDFEREIAEELENNGFDVKGGYETAGFKCDLLVTSKDGKKSVTIECDGVPDETKTNFSPIKKQIILERSGMKVMRISYREWTRSKQACLTRIAEEL